MPETMNPQTYAIVERIMRVCLLAAVLDNDIDKLKELGVKQMHGVKHAAKLMQKEYVKLGTFYWNTQENETAEKESFKLQDQIEKIGSILSRIAPSRFEDLENLLLTFEKL